MGFLHDLSTPEGKTKFAEWAEHFVIDQDFKHHAHRGIDAVKKAEDAKGEPLTAEEGNRILNSFQPLTPESAYALLISSNLQAIVGEDAVRQGINGLCSTEQNTEAGNLFKEIAIRVLLSEPKIVGDYHNHSASYGIVTVRAQSPEQALPVVHQHVSAWADRNEQVHRYSLNEVPVCKYPYLFEFAYRYSV